MNISVQFNKFYHGVVLKEVLTIPLIRVEDIVIGGHPFEFCPGRMKRQFGSKLDSVKMLLKKLNLDYPRDGDGEPISTTKISTQELRLHIEKIIKMVGDAGYTLPHVIREWENLLLRCGITK